MKMVKVAVCLFAVSKMGGIWTFHKEIVAGFRDAGYQVQDFLITNKERVGKRHIRRERTMQIEDEGILKMRELGFRSKLLLEQYKNVMSVYDVVLFTHACPHETKGFDDDAWMQCYNIPQVKIAAFHDAMADSHYNWVRKAKIDYAVAVQPRCLLSTRILKKEIPVMLSRHPMDLSDMYNDFNNRDDSIIAPHQFRTWKRMEEIIRAVPKINRKVHIFGLGTEFFYMQRCSYPYLRLSAEREDSKATKILQEYLKSGEEEEDEGGHIPMIIKKYHQYGDIWKQAMDHGMVHHQVAPRNELVAQFKKSVGVIDISTGEFGKRLSRIHPHFSLQNYSMLEGIKYGCMPIVARFHIQYPFDRESFLVAEEDDIVGNTAKCANFEFDDKIRGRILRNQILLKKYFNRRDIAQSYIDFVNGKIEPLKYHKIFDTVEGVEEKLEKEEEDEE